MSTQNKLILRRFFEELFNQGNLAAADEIVSETYVNHNAVPGVHQPDHQGRSRWAVGHDAGRGDVRARRVPGPGSGGACGREDRNG